MAMTAMPTETASTETTSIQRRRTTSRPATRVGRINLNSAASPVAMVPFPAMATVGKGFSLKRISFTERTPTSRLPV